MEQPYSAIAAARLRRSSGLSHAHLQAWWHGQVLDLELRLRSPLHDDGALVLSRLELEPSQPDDPDGVLLAPALELIAQGDPEPQQQLARALAALEIGRAHV